MRYYEVVSDKLLLAEVAGAAEKRGVPLDVPGGASQVTSSWNYSHLLPAEACRPIFGEACRNTRHRLRFCGWDDGAAFVAELLPGGTWTEIVGRN